MAVSTFEHVTFIAPDITCGHCVAKTQDVVRKLDGVTEVHSNAETKFVDVDFDSSVITADQISAELSKAGYPVRH